MTIVEIAKLAGTSVATVSRVMNNNTHVSEEVRLKVQAVLDETHFVPNYMGRNLRKNRSSRILVVLPTISTPAYGELVQAMTDKAEALGYSIMFVVTNRCTEKEKEYLEILETKSFAGVMLVATTLDTGTIEALAEDYPVVVCNTKIHSPVVSFVTIDNRQAAYDTTVRLIRSGHRDIAAIRFCRHIKNQDERVFGYKDAMLEAGFPIPDEYIMCDNVDKPLEQQLDEAFNLPQRPSAIVSFGDMSAITAVKYAQEHNISISKDLEIVGFGNLDYSICGVPYLAVVSVPWYEMGEYAVDLMMERITSPETVAKGIILPYRFVPSSAETAVKIRTGDIEKRKKHICQL